MTSSLEVSSFPHITTAVKQVQDLYKMSLSPNILPILPKPWRAISVGGDEHKLLAANEELGIFIKRYAMSQYADLVYLGYLSIRPQVEEAKFSLQFPLGVYGDALIYPLLDPYSAFEDSYEGPSTLKKIINKIELPLDLASILGCMRTRGQKGIVYTDPFNDSLINLYMKTKVSPEG